MPDLGLTLLLNVMTYIQIYTYYVNSAIQAGFLGLEFLESTTWLRTFFNFLLLNLWLIKLALKRHVECQWLLGRWIIFLIWLGVFNRPFSFFYSITIICHIDFDIGLPLTV